MLEMYRVCTCGGKRKVRRIDMTKNSNIAFHIEPLTSEIFVVARGDGNYYNLDCPLCGHYSVILVTSSPDDKPMHPVKRS
jgi:hypothetical protein